MRIFDINKSISENLKNEIGFAIRDCESKVVYSNCNEW